MGSKHETLSASHYVPHALLFVAENSRSNVDKHTFRDVDFVGSKINMVLPVPRVYQLASAA